MAAPPVGVDYRFERAVDRFLHRARAQDLRGAVKQVIVDVNESLAHEAEYI